jgi:Tfp pilus assembly protein PilF
MICARGEPAYGYATLAQILSHGDYGRYCNTVLTTNFDDLIADALYLYGERHARPLVVTHEALARYVRTNSPRPTIVKLHGDAHLDPKNLQPETREIDTALAKQLYPFLQDHALIFVGYGGNDESILKFVQNCPVPALAPPIFWISKREAPTPFHEWLCDREALRVDHTDFDQLMRLIRNALNINLIDRKRWNQIGDRYYEAFETLKTEIEKLTIRSEDTLALKLATSAAEKTLPDDWAYVALAREQRNSSPDEADRLYREGLEKFPTSWALHNNYAVFLEGFRKDMDAAEIHYKRAIEANQNHSFTLAAYADFLQKVREDTNGAEVHYKRAIEVDPNYCYALNGYANFLRSVRQDMDAAEAYYKRAIEADPQDQHALTSYARFLQDVRADMDAAETYYKRAIEAKPNYSYALGYYARFLQKVRKDMDAAEVYYKRALEAEPDSSYYRGFYNAFLEAREQS